MVCFQSILCGEASTSRLPGINPAGYANHTGYQYDSISRVAGHRELAPPSKFSKLGGFNNKVFITSGILHPQLQIVRLCRPAGRRCSQQWNNSAEPPKVSASSLPELAVWLQTFLRTVFPCIEWRYTALNGDGNRPRILHSELFSARKRWCNRSVVGAERTKRTIVRETLQAETGKTLNIGEQEPAAVIHRKAHRRGVPPPWRQKELGSY